MSRRTRLPACIAYLTGLANPAVWSALERKGLIKSMFPMAAVMTPAGLAYDTGLADAILRRHGHH